MFPNRNNNSTPTSEHSCLNQHFNLSKDAEPCDSSYGLKPCNALIPNTEDNAKVPEVGALLPGKTENFQDRSPQ